MTEKVSKSLDEKYYVIDHKSGLKIYVMPKENYSSTYAIFGTNYGSIDTKFKRSDKDEWTVVPEGIAHFLEHKLFESEDLDAFARYAKTGASANAYTSFDRTCYLFQCSDNFEASLEILLDFVTHPYFTKETVEKEQGIIGQEITMYYDVASWMSTFNLLRLLYHKHPVRIDIAGTVESISQITDKRHLGGFVCNNCGYKRPQPDFAVESVEEMKNDHSVVVANLNGDRNIIKVNIGGAYNIYNAIGCAAALTALGIEQKNIIDAIENFNGAFGRMEHFKAGNNTVNLILVKNPAGFSQTMNFLKSIDDDFTLILSLNDNAADGRDISWIWDVDFSGIFDKPNVKELYVTGKRCYDMAVRVKYEGIGNREIKIIENEDYNKLVDVATSQGRDVYIVPTYTSMMTMRPVIAKRLGGKDFWE